ncbi:hypothetical protein [Paenibacillus sp. IITD108]|uniref:hypothetical protein n=1 Tax=Paenibacillus sp. IITD108 TaxID=3116649 RepID=UPI002F4128AD
MKFVYTIILFLLIVSLAIVVIILDHADTKNQVYLEMAITEAILKAAPYGYITPEIQQEVKQFLVDARSFKSENIIMEGTINLAERKIKGSGDERIHLKITYPRTVLIFFGNIINKPIGSYRYINTEFPTS